MASPNKRDHLSYSYSYSTAVFTTDQTLIYSMGPGISGTYTSGHSTYSSVIAVPVTISASPSYNLSSISALPSTSGFGDEMPGDAETILFSANAGTTTTVSSPTRGSTSPSTTGLVIDNTIQSPAPTDGTAGIISPATAPPETPLHYPQGQAITPTRRGRRDSRPLRHRLRSDVPAHAAEGEKEAGTGDDDAVWRGGAV